MVNDSGRQDVVKIATIITAAFILTLSTMPASAGVISSSFSTGAEGWSALDDTGHDYTASWTSAGGNPGGFLQGTETAPAGGTGYFIAPSKFLGNLSSFAGGSLGYDFKVLQGTNYFNDVDVIISNGANSVSWFSNVNPVGGGWVPFHVALTQANFGSNLAAVLSNVTEFRIRGEYINGTEEEGLDNVILRTTTVPEPASWAMLVVGFGIVGAAARRRRPGSVAA